MTPLERLLAYRERHTIKVVGGDSWAYCAHDLIRVVPRFGPRLRQGHRHDPDEIRRLVKEGGRG